MSGSSSAVSHPAAGVDSHDVSRALEQRYDRILREHGPALRRVAADLRGRSRPPGGPVPGDLPGALAGAPPLPRRLLGADLRLPHRPQPRPHPRLAGPGRAGATLEEAEEIADPRRDPESELHEGERRDRLREAVRRLPLVARQVVVLSLEGLSQREIGEVLGMTENNVAVRLTRARKLLRQALKRKGAGMSAIDPEWRDLMADWQSEEPDEPRRPSRTRSGSASGARCGATATG